MIRHLLYQLAPTRNGEWVSCVQELKEYIDVFNGRRVIVTRFGEDLHNPSDVLDELRTLGEMDIRWRANDPVGRENDGFLPYLREFYTNRREALFYAHSRGVRYETGDRKIDPIRKWRQEGLRLSLRDVQAVEGLLDKYPCAGPHKRGNEGYWHYFGAFFWLRLDAVFDNPRWMFLHRGEHKIEGYPQELFSINEAADLGGAAGNLYRPDAWKS